MISSRILRGNASLFAIAAGSLLVAGAAHAQDAAAPAAPDQTADAAAQDNGEIVVQGFRSSLAKALEVKRDSSGAVDSIVAEDIAKFPDNNLAESVQRIPGVSITRDGGAGRQLTVRGLGADFTRTRLNGMEAQATTSGIGSSGGTNAGRGFDFNIFASELFSQIDVRKTASADVDEGSLGATVDLHTGRPFDYNGFKLAASAQGSMAEQRGRIDPRIAGLISDTFADGTVGVLVSAVYSRRSARAEGSQSGQWDFATNNGGFGASTAPGIPLSTLNSPNLYVPRFPRYGLYQIDEDRLGFTGALQFRPSDNTLISFDAAYAKLDASRNEKYIEAIGLAFPASRGGRPGMTLIDGEIQGNQLVYGKFNGADIRAEDSISDYTTKFQQYTAEIEQGIGERFKIHALAGISKSDFDIINLTVQADHYNDNGYFYDYRNNYRNPAIGYGFDITDPNQWYIGPGVNTGGATFPGSPSLGHGVETPEIRYRPQQIQNEFRTASVDFTYNIADGLDLKFGGQLKRFSFGIESQRTATELDIPAPPAGHTVADLMTVSHIIQHVDVPAGTPTTWAGPDVQKFLDIYHIYDNTGYFTLFGADSVAARGDIRSVIEHDKSAYGQINFKTDLGGIKLRGDVGLRYVKTGQSSTGYADNGSGYNQVTIDRDYDAWLPSANIAADLTSQLVFRVGAAKVMSRPPLANLTPGGSVTVGSGRAVKVGNPFLEPIRATTVDAALEWYFAPQSLLSFAVFYKDIGTYVQSLTEIRPFNTSGLPDSILNGTGIAPTENFTFTTPVNTKGGPLKGFEINYQQPLRFLPGPLGNLGVLLNYTYVDSKIDYVLNAATGTFTSDDLVGLSKNAFNATLYYEDSKLSGRVSGAYRSGFLRQVPGPFGLPTSGTEGSFYLDASLSYKITKQVTFTLEAENLTDEYDDLYITNMDGSHVSEDYRHAGRQYSAGIRFSF